MYTKLTNEELELIVTALLFSASEDICMDIVEEDEKKMIEIAKQIYKNKLNLKLTKLSCDKEMEFSNNKTKEILENFNLN